MASDTDLSFEDLGHQGRPPDDSAPPCVRCGVQDPWWRMRRSDTAQWVVEELCYDCDQYAEREAQMKRTLGELGVTGGPA